jgi:hypothetical protein
MTYMLNGAELNELTLNGLPGSNPPTPADELSYAGFGLQNASVITEKLTVSPPAVSLVERGYPRAHGSYAETSWSRRTVITVTGVLVAATREALETLMDSLAAAAATRDGTFAALRSGSVRYWEGCQPIGLESLFAGREHYHVTHCPFTLQLACLSPFARSGARVPLVTAGPTAAAQTTYVVDSVGNAPTSPQWTLVAVTAGTLSSLTLRNETTGEQMALAGPFADGDYLFVDGERKKVTVNGADADYTGVFPSVIPGLNAFTLTAAGASFSVSVSERHYPRWQ